MKIAEKVFVLLLLVGLLFKLLALPGQSFLIGSSSALLSVSYLFLGYYIFRRADFNNRWLSIFCGMTFSIGIISALFLFLSFEKWRFFSTIAIILMGLTFIVIQVLQNKKANKEYYNPLFFRAIIIVSMLVLLKFVTIPISSLQNSNNEHWIRLSSMVPATGFEADNECHGINMRFDSPESVIKSVATNSNPHEISIDSFSLNLRLGAYYLQINSIDSGFHYLTKAQSIDSLNAIVNYNLALYYSRIGVYEKALWYTELSDRRCPDRPSTLSNKCHYLGLLNRNEEALFFAKKSLAIDSSHHKGYINAIICFNALNQQDSVKKYLTIMDTKFRTEGEFWEKLRNGIPVKYAK